MARYVIKPSCIKFAGRRQIPTQRYPKVLSNFASLIESMTLSLNCKDAGDPVCTHTMYGETEEELLQNAKEHGIKVHGYTEETWNEEIQKNSEHFRKLIKRS
jgi:predicted small metal-binding protein